MKKMVSLLLAMCMMLSLLVGCGAPAPSSEASGGLTVNVTVPADFEGELNGRLLFVLDNAMPEEGAQVFDNIDVTGCPVFGKTVYGLKAGDTITMTANDSDVYGYPMQLSEVPDGEYAVQALFVRYTQFNRADGVSLWGMADHGGGGSVACFLVGADVIDQKLVSIYYSKF